MRIHSYITLMLAPLTIASLTGCATQPKGLSQGQGLQSRAAALSSYAYDYEAEGRPDLAYRMYEHVLAIQPEDRNAQQRLEHLARSGVTPAPLDDAGRFDPTTPATNYSLAAKPKNSPAQRLIQSERNRAHEELLAEALRKPASTSQDSSVPSLPKSQTGTPEKISQVVAETAASPDGFQAWAQETELASLADADLPKVVPAEPKSDTASDADLDSSLGWTTTDLTRDVAEADVSDSDAWGKTRLVNLCEELPEDLVPLVERLDSAESADKVQALMELGELKTEAEAASLAVVALLDDADPLVSVYAAGALRDITGDAWESVHTLSHHLESDNEQVVRLAAYLLGQMGPEAMDAVDALQDVREDAQGLTALYAAEALINITPDDRDSLNLLTTSLASSDEKVRWFAAVSLGGVSGDLEAEAAIALLSAMQDDAEDVRAAVCLSLGGLGEHAKIAQIELQVLAEMDTEEVQSAARTALACLPSDAELLEQTGN